MKLEEIQELWNRDRDIDIEELAIESSRIPQKKYHSHAREN